ncbi:hypothetical protein NWI01_28290 [Nitrobacter winogradskyi]|uniref:Uncharacterized protein n=1 Tax=Nitrobacter winogradskyi TaxID=913 RepID=A0A4Y3WD37_NITWI|nr:hypothetical protein NWI01_28290 [Nitrobacter winogradskyi]
MIHGIHAVQSAPHVVRIQDRSLDEFRHGSGWRRLQIQDADDAVPAAQRRNQMLSDESISTCDKYRATAGKRRSGARLQRYGFHVRSSKEIDPVMKILHRRAVPTFNDPNAFRIQQMIPPALAHKALRRARPDE